MPSSFVKRIWTAALAKSDYVALENPKGVLSSRWMKPTQYVSPHQHGSKMKKTTGLWLHNLPMLVPTQVVEPDVVTTRDGRRVNRWHIETGRLRRDHGQ